MTNPADEPAALQQAYEPDRLEQQIPVSPDEADDGVLGEAPAGSPALPGGSEADRMEQQLPGTGTTGPAAPAPLGAADEGSEADRIEQAMGISGVDEDDYPHGSAE